MTFRPNTQEEICIFIITTKLHFQFLGTQGRLTDKNNIDYRRTIIENVSASHMKISKTFCNKSIDLIL